MTTRRTKSTHPGLARPGARARPEATRAPSREDASTASPSPEVDAGTGPANPGPGDDGWPEESPTFPTGPLSEAVVRTSGSNDGPGESPESASDTVPPAPPPDDGASLDDDNDEPEAEGSDAQAGVSSRDATVGSSGTAPDDRTPSVDAEAPVDFGQPPAGDGAPPRERGEPSEIEEARGLSHDHLRGLLEALVFASDKPIAANELARMASAPLKEVKATMAELRGAYRHRGIVLDEVAGGWTFRTHVQFGPFVRELTSERPVKLSRAQVETLAIVAYRQPITRPEIDDIRGVDSGATLKLLLERDLVRILGKKDEPGRPILYGTTAQFLEFFGLKSLKELPTLREFTELSEDSRRVAESELGAVFGSLSGVQPPSVDGPAGDAGRAGDADAAGAEAGDAARPSAAFEREAVGRVRHDTVVPDAPATGQELEDPPDRP